MDNPNNLGSILDPKSKLILNKVDPLHRATAVNYAIHLLQKSVVFKTFFDNSNKDVKVAEDLSSNDEVDEVIDSEVEVVETTTNKTTNQIDKTPTQSKSFSWG